MKSRISNMKRRIDLVWWYWWIQLPWNFTALIKLMNILDLINTTIPKRCLVSYKLTRKVIKSLFYLIWNKILQFSLINYQLTRMYEIVTEMLKKFLWLYQTMQYFNDTGGAMEMSRHIGKWKRLAVFCALREKTHDWLHCKRNDVLPTICLGSSVELLGNQRYQ